MFDRHNRWQRREHFRERFFGRGDLKYVILDLVKDQPRHGYDIIREMEGRFGGMYAPSPGTVYPTLSLLEDMGLVSVVQQEDRKVYTITEAGRQYLTEHSETLDDIFGRMRTWWQREGASEIQDTMKEVGETIAYLSRQGSRMWSDPEKSRQVKEVLNRTRKELRDIFETV